MTGLEGVYAERSSVKEATYMPNLEAAASPAQIINALEDALPYFNMGADHAVRYGMKDRKYQTGSLDLVIDRRGDALIVGTKGPYPSANMALVALDGDEVYRFLREGHKISAGTEFCFVHVQWDEHPWEHDLPMQESFYRSVRRTLAGHFEQGLRQQDI
ncbi:hypothetical protein KY362_08010 [Candidatus Woesearchaeota archaeon]|nr:hypothetical protein [Candidatus Woesearchaeota archaeon]